MSRKLESMGVTDCGDLQKISLQVLQKEFGPKTGQALYKSCRGQDDRPIKVERERKSVSAEINYGIRFTKVRYAVLKSGIFQKLTSKRIVMDLSEIF